MNEFTAWIQSNWYALGNLLSQIAFLGAGLWFARKILKSMRASQEQVGALLKLSITGADRHMSPFANASPYWLMPAEETPTTSVPLEERRPSLWAVAKAKLTAAGSYLIVWLQTPMGHGGAGPWRKAMRWLQSPARS